MNQFQALTNMGHDINDAKRLIASAPPCPDWYKTDPRTSEPERLQMLSVPPGVDDKKWLGLVQMGNAADLLKTEISGISDLEVRAIAGMHIKALRPYWEAVVKFLDAKNDWIMENRMDRAASWPVLWAMRVMEITEVVFQTEPESDEDDDDDLLKFPEERSEELLADAATD